MQEGIGVIEASQKTILQRSGGREEIHFLFQGRLKAVQLSGGKCGVNTRAGWPLLGGAAWRPWARPAPWQISPCLGEGLFGVFFVR